MFNHKALYPVKSAVMFILFLLPIIYFKWKCEKIKPVRPSCILFNIFQFRTGENKMTTTGKIFLSEKKCWLFRYKKKTRENFLYSLKLTAASGGELIFHRHIWCLIFDSNITLYTDHGTAG